MDKDILRKDILDVRKSIKEKDEKSTIIVNKIINLDLFQKANVIALYKSMKNEVNMDYLINYALKCGKKVLLPKVLNNDLVFIEYKNGDILEMSDFGVLEPFIDGKVYNEKIDLIIVPGLAFDNENNRLGYGKGYYDRALLNRNSYKIGVCYQEQIVDLVPTFDSDIKMDLIITDKKT